MKRLIITIGLLMLVGAGCTSVGTDTNSVKVSVGANHRLSQVPYSNSVVCKMTISASATYDSLDKEITVGAGVESTETTLTLTDLNTNNPRLVGNYGDELSLSKIEVGQDLIYLLERTPTGNLNLYTLFRNKNILFLTKQYELLEPFGLLWVGDCLSGL